MASGDTKTQQYLDIAANGTRADLPSDTCCETRTQTLIRGVAERIMDVEDEVERLENNPDVVDIVATYADLQNYDTSGLTDKDVVRVLQDETHNGDSTYYRWSTTAQTWTYIGESKQYVDFVGTDGTNAGVSGLVPAPAATDAGKVLGADGTWVIGGPTVVQTTGTSTTKVMSQNAVTSMVYADPSTKRKIQIGQTAIANGANAIAVGASAVVAGLCNSGVAIGPAAITQPENGVATYGQVSIGNGAQSFANYSVAIGYGAKATVKGQFDISTQATTNTNGYNNSQYRLLTGLYDPQNAHDAATKGYVDTAVAGAGTAFTNAEFNSIFDTSLMEGA